MKNCCANRTQSRYILSVMIVLFSLGVMAQQDSVQWYDRVHQLDGITVDKKREAYSRKDNQAVELMKKVIGHKRMTDPTKKTYCNYDTYQ